MLLRHVYRPLPVYSAPQRHPHLTSLLLSSLFLPPPSFTSRTHPRLPLLDRSYDFDAVKSWTKKRKMKFGGTFDMDLLIVPVHIGVHWTLAVINLPQRRIEYYDALHDPPAEDTVQALRDWLNDESLDKRGEAFDASDFEVYVPHDVPGQKNATDCGMFMCMYVYSRGEGGRYLSCICLCNSVVCFPNLANSYPHPSFAVPLLDRYALCRSLGQEAPFDFEQEDINNVRVRAALDICDRGNL